MAASENLSSARVAPRSVTRVAATSIETSSGVDAVLGDVLPHVELGPVADREHADALALAVLPVVERPQLGALVLRVPLTEVVPEAEHPLLGPSLLLVTTAATDGAVEAVCLERVEQRRGL